LEPKAGVKDPEPIDDTAGAHGFATPGPDYAPPGHSPLLEACPGQFAEAGAWECTGPSLSWRYRSPKRLFGTSRQVRRGAALLPLIDGLGVDPVALGQRSQARLTILYCSTDCLRRCGAAVENLSHSASFHCLESNAPSNPGIRQLAAWLEYRRHGKPIHAGMMGCQRVSLIRSVTTRSSVPILLHVVA
jgi:hypothetical protein